MPSDKQQLPSALLQVPSRHGDSDDDSDDGDVSVSVSAMRAGSKLTSLSHAEAQEDYAENTPKLVRLRRHVTALRACRMVTVWPSEEDEDRVSGR